MQNTTQRLDQLTFTRFIAALTVLFYHSGRDVGILQYLPFFTSGQTAVSYFYVLSGFVMAYVYVRPNSTFNLREYFLARFSRIYPVYIVSFILTFFYFIEKVPKTSTNEIFANLFLYQAWIPAYSSRYNVAAWSLSVELFFYMLLPFMVWYALRKSVKHLIVFSLIFWIVSHLFHSFLFIVTAPVRPMFFLAFFPPFHLNAFVIGFAGGAWFLNQKTEQKLSVFAKIVLLSLPLVMVCIGIYYRDVKHTFGNTFYLDAGLFAPFFLITILTLASDSSKLSNILSHRWLVLLGDASYAIYILHEPLRWLLQSVIDGFPSLKFLSIYYPLTIIVCILIYQYFEVPVRNWLRDNPQKLIHIFLHGTLIALMIKLSLLIRFGFNNTDILRTQRFIVFFGTIIFFVLLITFQFYKTYSWRALVGSSILGALFLTGIVYYAWQMKWIEGFPRPVLAMIPVLVFLSIYLSRYISAKMQVR